MKIFRGVKEVIIRRLKNHYKKRRSAKPKKKSDGSTSKTESGQDYFVVIDFEGTCEEKNEFGYVHEIIEFPAVLLNARTLELVCIACQAPPSLSPRFLTTVISLF